MQIRLLMAIGILLIAGCEKKESSSNEESSDREIEIARLVYLEGDKIATLAQKALGSQLKKALTEQGPAHAVQFCNLAAYPILDTLDTEFRVTIRRASLRSRNKEDDPGPLEKDILLKYEQKLEMEEGLKAEVIFENGSILFAKPILIKDALCLNCHGEVGSQIADETYYLLEKLYPEDNAINHSMGDLRGIWSISFEKSELIDYLNKEGKI